MSARIFLLTIGFVISAGSIFCQNQLIFEHLSGAEGLSENIVNDIIQDNKLTYPNIKN